MKADEARHATMAEAAGARDLPLPLQRAMAFTAGIMKALAYRI
jgi:demethoxyubiquinone hydroxylase (CLK1/Coq7/Cat5 family)